MLRDEELTYRIRGAVYEVNKVLGPGFLEAAGHRTGLLINFTFPKATIKRIVL